ncbi:MAG: NADH-quinone oxidoreductase subunit C [Thermodesulfobacteriota bacterium]
MSLDIESLIEALNNENPAPVKERITFRGETTLVIDKDRISDVCRRLKELFGFTFLADLTAVDYLEVKSPRYEVVYHVHRFGPEIDENIRIRLKAELDGDDPKIDSVTDIWSGADWLEREVYDMFGIVFTGHPDLRRILMPEDYEPYPLRKDFDVRDREASRRSFERALREGTE